MSEERRRRRLFVQTSVSLLACFLIRGSLEAHGECLNRSDVIELNNHPFVCSPPPSSFLIRVLGRPSRLTAAAASFRLSRAEVGGQRT